MPDATSNDLNGASRESDDSPRRGVPTVVWTITALHVALLLAYSLLAPTYRAPDEPLHVDLAHLFAEDLRYPAWYDRDTGVGVLRSLDRSDFHNGSEHLEAGAAPSRGDRPSIDELDQRERSGSINQLPQHPPLYYVIAGSAERVAELVTGDPLGAYDLETWFYRLVSIAIVSPLPIVIWRTARRIGLPDMVALGATLFPLTVPNYLHMGAAVNNDSLMLLLFWLLTPLVIRLAQGDVGLRTSALAGLVTGLALFTKGFAFVLPLWVLGALAVALRRLGRPHLRRVAHAGLTYAALALATGGWWWVANVIRYGELAPSRYSDLVSPVENDSRDLGKFVEQWSTITTRRFWGDFGGLYIPGYVVAAASVVVIVGIVIACTRRDRVAGTPVGDRLLLAAPFLLLVAVQFANALRGYLALGRMPGLQGRYWFGAMAALAVIVTLGLANLLRHAVRVLPLGMFAAAVAMNTFGVAAMLGHHWGAPGSAIKDRFGAVVAWAPVEGELIAGGAVLGGGILAATIVQLVLLSKRPFDETSSDTGAPEAVAAGASPAHS
jgi:hypothetical protein